MIYVRCPKSDTFMKKIVLFLSFVLTTIGTSFAQFGAGGPKFSFSSADPCTNEEFCISVTVEDFTDLTSVKFPIQWNPDIIEFVRVDGLNLGRLTSDDFDVSRTDEGLLFLDWEFEDCGTAPSAVTLIDSVAIFQICFRAISSYGASTTIEIINDSNITGDPTPIDVKRLGVCTQNIGLRLGEGIVTTCVRPLNLVASNTSGNPGELVCVDVKVEGFDELIGMQFSMNWDSSVLQFEEVIPTENLTNLNKSDFGTPDNGNIGPGRLTVSWTFLDPIDLGESLADGTSIFQVCFRVIGDCEMSTPFEFNSNPTRIEAFNSLNDTVTIPVTTQPGLVETGLCEPEGLQIAVDCGDSVSLNDQFCVVFSANAPLNDVDEIRYLMEWNPSILEFVEIRSINNGLIPGLNSDDFDESNTRNGILGLDWRATSPAFAADFSLGDQLYEICFNVIGLGGDSPVRINTASDRVTLINSARNIGVFPSNCAVEVRQPESVRVAIGEARGVQGDIVCVDVAVGNFSDVLSLQFPLGWEPAEIEFTNVQNVHPLFDIADINTSFAGSGGIQFDWNGSGNGNAQSLPEGTVIFTICFRVVGDPPGELGLPENCSPINMVGVLEAEAVTNESNGNNVGIIPTPGEVCVLNPEGFFLVIDQQNSYQDDTICVPLSVRGFNEITSARFSANWSPSLLEFQEIQLGDNPLGLELGVTLNTNSADVGLIEFDWDDPMGVTLPDSTTIFSVCFAVVGEPDTCVMIDIESDPTPSVTTVNGAGSIFPLAGEVCIRDTIIILGANITPVSCPNGRDGSIELLVKDYNPDANPQTIFFNWNSTPQQFGEEAINLREGEVAVSVFTNTVPPVIVRDTFMIPLTTNLPQADAGADQVFDCSGPAFIITGSGSTGDEFRYEWSTIGGVLAGAVDRRSVPVTSPGLYILEVINQNSGCSATDTMEVVAPPTPRADAGDDFTFDCSQPTFQLDGSGSETVGVRYEWSEFNGGLIFPGEELLQNPRIQAAGTFILEVIDTMTQCSALDTVVVFNSAIFPDANAGLDLELGCDSATVRLDGSLSENLQDVTFAWFDASGQQLSDGVTATADTIGAYILEVTDFETGCQSFDTVMVVPSADFPEVMAGGMQTLDCNNEIIILQASIVSNNDFDFTWTTLDTGIFETGTDVLLQPTVIQAGTFVLTAVNNVSGCVSTDTAIVRDNIIRPMVDAGQGGSLTCVDSLFTINGSGVFAPDSLRYTWLLNGQTVAIDTFSVEVATGGTYTLLVEDLSSGCSNTDTTVVIDATGGPTFRIMDMPTITCSTPNVNIEGELIPANGNYNILWSVPNGSTGEIISGNDQLVPTVSKAGLYEVSVIDINTGCNSVRPVEVLSDTLAPVADAGMDMLITCQVDSVTLNGIGSGTGASIVYEWVAVNNGINPSPANTLQTVAIVADQYVLTVRDTANGCFAIDTVVVDENTSPPAISVAQPATITCDVPSVNLDGTGSDQNGDFDLQWTSVDGQPAPQVTNNPYIVSVTAGGNYQLNMTNLITGCSNSLIISVLEDRVSPTADPGPTQLLECPGTLVTLDGSASSIGTIYTYSWTTLSGSGTITSAGTLNPSVDAVGEYQLEVVNTNTGCSATGIVAVQRDPQLVDADAGEDQTTCSADGMLFASNVGAATGRWTSLDNDVIDLPSDANSGIGDLENGPNQFVWTVSLDNCPDYDADTVSVTREVAPIAGNDQITLNVGEVNRVINVLANDQFRAGADLTITIINNPALGSIGTISNNQVPYTSTPGLSGDDEFIYEVCITQCIELCDSAIVRITVPFDASVEIEAPDGITPNGDGLNDRLVFDILDNTPEQFEDNEIVIFNRWGDIVYQAAPYNNEWQGQNSGGLELPAGTYYYILRLNINEGQILRGDVTIVR